MGSKTSISVILPVYGDNEPVDLVLSEIHASLAQVPSLEVIIVWTPNHASSGQASPCRSKWNHTSIIVETRPGYGRAYLTGFAHATKDVIVTLDADGTYPARQILQLVRHLESASLDFLSTNRLKNYEAGAFTPINRLGNFFLSSLLRLLFRAKFKDSQSGMWIFKRSILKALRLQETGMAFSSEIKIEAHLAGYKYTEVIVHYKRRKGGKTSLNWIRDGLRIVKFFLRKKINSLRSS
jgi:glycosyltransferase involved in cell wall biosynthesis